jgi:hypothetical protein
LSARRALTLLSSKKSKIQVEERPGRRVAAVEELLRAARKR